MELKQQLKQFAASSTAVKEPQSSGGDKQATALQKIAKNKQQALEVMIISSGKLTQCKVYAFVVCVN